MNIFKILANGSGSINEPNVSAFLGYLLDPQEDHALGYEFLKRFLKPYIDDFEPEGEFEVEQYDYQVFLEQSFREKKNPEQIVDIVIIAHSTEIGTSKRSYVKGFLGNKKKLKKIFLIENKIRPDSITPDQLVNQIKATLEDLEEILTPDKEQVHSIYVTPECEEAKKEFQKSSKEDNNLTHVFWDDGPQSIKSILIDILKEESEGKIDALNLYTSQTLKAFIQFIATGFRSEKAEERRRKDPAQSRIDAENINEETGVEKNLDILKSKLESVIPELNGKIDGPDLSKPRFPQLQIRYKGIVIQIASSSEARDGVMFWLTVDRKDAIKSGAKLEKLAELRGLQVKKKKYKYGKYIRTTEMKKPIPFSDPDKIVEVVKNSLDLLDKHLA